jgi:hypothetical protein
MTSLLIRRRWQVTVSSWKYLTLCSQSGRTVLYRLMKAGKLDRSDSLGAIMEGEGVRGTFLPPRPAFRHPRTTLILGSPIDRKLNLT